MIDLSGGIVLGILGYFGYMLKDIPHQIINFIHPFVTRKIEANSNDDSAAYRLVTNWVLLSFKMFDRQKQLCSFYDDDDSENFVEYIADGVYWRIKDKTICKIVKSRMELDNKVVYEIKVTFFGKKEEQLQKECLLYIRDNMPSKSTHVYVKKYDSERYIDPMYIPKRDFSTIYSPCVSNVKHDIDIFLSSKEQYKKRSIPYKTGFIFYGPPGTGKSSIARAIASYLNWKIWYISLTRSLENVCVPERTIILFEDFDFLVENREENIEKKNKNLFNIENNMHSLLNFLDGTLSPENVIFIATTNYIDRIDSAILRPGRFDHVYEMGLSDRETALKVCHDWGLPPSSLDGIKFPAPMAEIQNKLRRVGSN